MKIKILPIGKVDPLRGLGYRMELAIVNSLDMTARAIKVDFGVTTQTWRRRPMFQIDEPAWDTRDIYTTSEIYGYVSGGTRPHVIRPRMASRLAFPANYAAKTTPRSIASRPGGSSGPTVTAREVFHPGTQAREFDIVIAEKWGRQFPVTLDRAIAAAIG